MIGIIYALAAGFFISCRALLEKCIVKKTDEVFLAWCLRFFGAIFIWLIFFFLGHEFVVHDNIFWKFLILGGVLNSISSVFVLKALKVTDLSLIAPFTTITPIFVLIITPFILGEFPAFLGLIGVFCIVIGAYTLNIKEKKKGYLAPFRALLNNKGAWYMLGAVLIWSIGANVDKIGLEVSSPLVWAGSLQAMVVVLLLPVILIRRRFFETNNIDKKSIFLFPVLGLIAAFAGIFYMYSMSLILVVYASSLKRVSVIFEVFMGRYILKEKGFKERLIGVSIMILGTILIAFS